MEVRLEGQQQLFAALDRFERQAVLNDADTGLKKAGMQIIADAQMNLRRNTSVVTGFLRQSGKVQKAPDGDGYDVGFMSGEKNYAGAVEYGRRAGKMPPPSMLAQWFRKKFGMKDKEAERAGWGLARWIAKKGTKPHPFFAPAVKKNEQAVVKAISDAIKRTINRNGV